jgi:hypothetical protein
LEQNAEVTSVGGGVVDGDQGWDAIGAAPHQPAAGATRSSGAAVVADHPGAPTRGVRLRRSSRPILGAFDDGGVLFQRHTRTAVLGSAVVLAPAIVLQIVLEQMVYRRLDDLGVADDVVVSVADLFGGVDAATGIESVVGFVAVLVNSLAVALAGGLAATICLRDAAGLPCDLGATWRATVRFLPKLTVAWMFGHSWMVLGSLLLVQVPSGAIAPFAIVAGPFLLVLVSATALVSPVVVVERLGPWAAVKRSLRLFRRRWTTVCGFVLLCTLLGGGLRYGIASLPALAEETGLVTFGGATTAVTGVASQIGLLLVVPLVALATARFHLQLRMDAEGLDLLTERSRVFPVGGGR